ncbi:MAG: hypothetical protein KDA74_21485, partial [Planctomycetaceae bacterium]|nr:hypothetical protein [Planctomycetaceae bacterium]
RVKGTQITLKAADRQKVTLKPGQHVLHVRRDDVEFETKEFVISRDDTVVVRVDVLDGAVVARQNGTVIGRAGRDPLRPDSSPQSALPRRETSIDPDRAFFNWPQAPGMLLTIEIDGDRQQLTCRNANIPGIPAQPFHVVGVVFNLHQGKAATAADVARLISSGLQHVDTVGFNYQNPRPEWLEALHDAMPDVKNFEFAGLEEHIPVISRFEKLEYMQVAEKATEWIDMLSRKQSVERLLFSGRLSIADCEKLAKFSSLRELTFSDAITDEAFLALSKSSCLTRLQIYTKTREWNATAEGIAHLAKLESLRILTFGNNELPPIFNPQALKQKLPWCRIEFSQGGQMKILPAEPHPQARHTLQLHAM